MAAALLQLDKYLNNLYYLYVALRIHSINKSTGRAAFPLGRAQTCKRLDDNALFG